MDLKLPN